MKIKFRDSNNKIRIMVIDDETVSTGLLGGQEISRSAYVKENIKEAKQEMKKAFRGEEKKHITEFVETLNENDFLNALPDYKKLKVKKEDVVFFDPALLDRFYQFMEENYVSEEERLYYFFFTWDPNVIFRFDNRSNNPDAPSSIKKRINTKSITDLASRCNLECEDVVEEDGVDVLSLVGKKEDFHKFFQEVAKLLTEAEQSGKEKFGNYKASELEAIKEEEIAKIDSALKKVGEDKADTLTYIESNNKIISDPKSSKEDIEEAKLDNVDLEADLISENNEIDRLNEEKEKTLKAIEGSEYDADYVEKNYGYRNKGFIKYSTYSPTDVLDSKNWFGIKDCKFKFDFENSILTCDSKCYNYIKVMDALKKSYTDTKQEISFEKWISGNPKTVKNIISSLKEFTEKGDKNIMKDSLKNTKFRFGDGTIIEVVESDGKDFKTVKDEAIKVYKQFKEMKEKEPTALKDGEKETKEVLEEYDAKATNDSKTEDGLLEPTITPELSARKAFEEGKTVKEWFAEEGYKFFNGENSLENKTEAVKLWNKVKEALESEKQLAEHEADEAEWEEAFKNADAQEPTEHVEDSVEEKSEDKFEVIVNGKFIGTFDTEEEANEAEKKALEAVEKGIPNPTVE